MKNPKKPFNLDVEFTRAKDGRWVAEVRSLPGVKGTGFTRKEAFAEVESRALRAILDRMGKPDKL